MNEQQLPQASDTDVSQPQQEPQAGSTPEQSMREYYNAVYDDEVDNRAGFHFSPLGIVIAVLAVIYCAFGDYDGAYFIILSIVVLIHELGHYTMARAMGCEIKEVQLFFLQAISYRPAGRTPDGLPRTTWTIGALPLGGFTMFFFSEQYDFPPKLRHRFYDLLPPAKQLLIDAGGVIFNLLTFIACLFLMAIFGDSMILAHYIGTLSLILAVLNLIPIYPLDGGQIIVHFCELVLRRRLPKTFLTVARVIGSLLIIYLFFIDTGLIASILTSLGII